MAMDATRLASSIKSLLLANSDSRAVDNAALTALCQSIATAVVSEIQAHATVPSAGLVAPGGGGPVTGQAVVT